MGSELILVLKFGRELFSQTQLSKVLLWFVLNILVSCGGVLVSMQIYKWRFNKEAAAVETRDMTANEKVEEFLSGACNAEQEEDSQGQEQEEVVKESVNDKSDVDSMLRQRSAHLHTE